MKIIQAIFFLTICLVLFISGCGTTGSSGVYISTNADLVVKTDFTVAPQSIIQAARILTGYTQEHLTPSQYSIAFKSVKLIDGETGLPFTLFSKSSLASSEVINFTETLNIDTLASSIEIPAAYYNALKAEIYWVQMTFPIKASMQEGVAAKDMTPVTKNIRIYLSDDEAVEGGAHHQGDLTIINDQGEEIGWFAAPADFSGTTPRPTNEFASGLDPETGHDRGPFGDTIFWNTSYPEDLFVTNLTLNSVTITRPDFSSIVLNFDIKDTWEWDDVDEDGYFSPGPNAGDDANDLTKGWAPIFPGIDVTVE